MKCVNFIVFSIVLMTVMMFGPAGFAGQEDSQQENSASVAATDDSASQARGTVKESESKAVPVSSEPERAGSEGLGKTEEIGAGKSDAPATGEEKKAEVLPEKSDPAAEKSETPETGAEKKAEVSPEKSDASSEKADVSETGEEKTAEVSPEKSDASSEKTDAQESGAEKEAEVSPEKSDVSSEKADAQESGEEKKAEVLPETSDAPEKEKAQDSSVSPKTLSVQVNKANVRKEASLNAKINAQLKKGQAVNVIAIKDDWYHIQLDDGDHGWIHSSILGEKTLTEKDANPGDSIALTTNGNVRVSPDLNSEILTVLKKGHKVVLKESSAQWYHVQLPDDRQGWMHKKLFAKQRVHDLEGIRIEKDGKDREKVFFLYNGPKAPNIFITKAGSPRIICDFPNTRRGKGIGQQIEVKGQLIQAVRTGLHGEDKSDLRVVFDVSPEAEYELEHSFAEKKMYVLIVKKR